MNETNVSTVLESVDSYVNQLSTATPGVLVFVLVIGAAFALRWWKIFPDKLVRPCCTLGGMVVFCLLTPYAAEHMRVWLVKNAAIGFIISFAASLFILQFGEKIPFIGSLLKATPEAEIKPATPDDGD